MDDLILRVTANSAALGKGIHPLVINEIARLMVKVNSYYTNAMEGNPSKLKDIDAALDKKLDTDTTKRNFQLEHVAHIEVQEAMIRRLQEEPALRICSKDFLCWLHEQFVDRLPAALRYAKTEGGDLVPVESGRLRDRGISVGRHQAPETKFEIEGYLAEFERLLSPEDLVGQQKLLGMASSHHRFLWIHPFLEGNGRIARLLTTAYGVRIGMGNVPLWTVARAFARKREEYDAHLALADRPRRNSLDGRGPLSEEDFLAYCSYFLHCCDDQIGFMNNVLQFNELERRYRRFINGFSDEKQISKAGAKVMERIFLQGEIPRGQISDICDVKKRRATQITKELLDAKITRSETAYGPLRLNISADMAAALFPQLA